MVISKEQEETNGHINIDGILERYTPLPNEALYVVDYQNASFQPLTTNFSRLLGIDQLTSKDISYLYETVHRQNIPAFVRHTKALIGCGFDPHLHLQEEVDFAQTLFRSYNGKIFLKSTTVLKFDENGAMQYSLSRLIDITGLSPFQHFSYRFIGPNREQIYDLYRVLAGDDQMLSKREKEVLHLIGLGLTSRQIAERLYLSKHTVDQHRRNIISKLEVEESRAAYIKAKNFGIL